MTELAKNGAADDGDVSDTLDERKVGRALALGLPLVTGACAAVAGVVVGAHLAILVLAGGGLLAVIALFWASLRILSGDAALSPELEALDRSAHGVDALASRKKMLLRALKDLDNERALGKLEDEDYEQIGERYREELKGVLRRIDESLAPYLAKAEKAAQAHLAKAGLGGEAPYRAPEGEGSGEPEGSATSAGEGSGEPERAKGDVSAAARVACAACGASNEADAKFCKGCGGALAPKDEDRAEDS